MSTSREVMVDIGGKRYRIASDDSYLDHIKGCFEPDTVQLFRTLVEESDVVLDIGANIGCTALLFGGLCREVHAFEPSPTTFAFLEGNVSRSGLKNVRLHNVGLGAEPGRFPLTFSPANRSGAFVSTGTKASAGHAVEEVLIRPLDGVTTSLDIRKVDLIKIDVEGFEGHVLKGARRTLTTHQPTVVLELNHWCLNAFQRTSVPDFLDFLRSTFPILLAIDRSSAMDLHDHSESYVVMYHHILHMRFPSIVAAFSESRLSAFRRLYRHPFAP
jgi:FkbM family methyltransferase